MDALDMLMHAAIDFDDQSTFEAQEVDDERAERNLPAEAQTCNLPAPEL
jgi:hypothetical protein